MAEVHLRSSAQVRAKAAQIRAMSPRFLPRLVRAADRGVQGSFVPVLAGLVPSFMPSGYAPVLARSLRATTRPLLTGRTGVTVRVFAPTGGSAGGRDVRAKELGNLRHPIFATGPRSSWRWPKLPQRVRPGMAHSALKIVEPVIRKRVDDEIEDIVRELAR